MLYNDFGTWLRKQFPDFRVQKISIDAGFTCPNRDGRISTGGCSYCDNRTFNPSYCDRRKSIHKQLMDGKEFFNRKYKGMKYLAYFIKNNSGQDLDYVFIHWDDGYVCYKDVKNGEEMDMMDDNTKWKAASTGVNYNLYSVNKALVREEYEEEDYEDASELAALAMAVEATAERGIITGGHIILGLPGEDRQESLRQAPIISSLPLTILKIHQMQIIRGTRLAEEYAQNPFPLYTLEEYVHLIADYIQLLRKDLVLERFVSQSPPELLIAPRWGIKNYQFVNMLNKL